ARTTTRAPPGAGDSRALARQSMVETGSPGTYARNPEKSLPRPRRLLLADPNGSPVSRCLGTRGKVVRPEGSKTPLGRSGDRDLPVRPRRGDAREAEVAELDERVRIRQVAHLREEGRPEHQPVPEYGDEEGDDVGQGDVVAALEQRP